jgi:hypothetical protein
MRIISKGAVAALVFAMASGVGGIADAQLQLTKCKTRALIGGGVGAVAGALIAGKDDRTKGALIGGALGAAGTFGVCKWMDNRSQAKVEAGYQQAANSGKSYSSNWAAEDGTSRKLTVAKPVKEGNCRVLNSTLTAGGTKQAMPQEKYCQGADGVWRPAA